MVEAQARVSAIARGVATVWEDGVVGAITPGVDPWRKRVVIGEAVLLLGDCMAILPTLPQSDVVITDPPYDSKTHAGAATTFDATKDYGVPFTALCKPELLAEVLLHAASRWTLSFCAIEQIGAYSYGASESWIRAGIWDKIAPSPQITGDRPAQAVEGIAIMHPAGRKRWNRGGGAAIWRYLAPHGVERPDHPTPKPIALMEALLGDFTDRGETILDPFMGSGTTGVACMNLGRRFVGIEIEEKYFNIAVERITNAQRQAKLFDEPAAKPEQTTLL